MEKKTCCIAGNRLIAADIQAEITRGVQDEVLQAVEDGYTHFISGFAKGADLVFSSVVADLMENYPALTLEAVLPYRSRMNTTDKIFRRLIGKCSIVGLSDEEYIPGCYKKLDREMVSLSQRVIVVCDASKKGAAHFNMRCAYMQGKEVKVVPAGK